jgi:uncharacterized protein YndB with AHSA1/START domain
VTGNQSDVRKQTSKQGKIVKKVWIRASKDVVYKALTESKELVQWFCDRATLDARKDGELIAYWKSGKTSHKGRAVITRLVPGSVLELLWVDEGDGPKENGGTHTCCYEIRAKSGMTELLLTDCDESGSDSEELTALDQGWNTLLMDLRDHCERNERSEKLRGQPGSKTRDTLSE